MTSGSIDKGNGLANPLPGQPRIYDLRTWSGDDSILTRTLSFFTEVTRYRKERVVIPIWKYQQAKNGKWVWVRREAVTHKRVPYTKRIKVWRRETIQDSGRGVAPPVGSTITSLIPDALKRREYAAGLTDLGFSQTVHERRSDQRYTYFERPPKRARLEDNAYIMRHLYMYDVHVHRLWYGTKQYLPKVCFPPEPTDGGGIMRGAYAEWSASDILGANGQIKLVNRLREKLVGSSFNMGVMLGELNESVELVLNSAVRLNRYLTQLKRGNFRDALRTLVERDFKGRKSSVKGITPDEIASKHLEMTYGWKPLLSDAKEGAEALAHALNVPYQKTYRTSLSKTVLLGSSYVVGSDCSYPDTTYESLALKTHRRSIIAKFREKPSLPKLLGLLDPEVILLEKTHWSFVADWFIPLSDWLTARGFAQGLDATFVTSDRMIGIAFPPSTGGTERYFVTDPSDDKSLALFKDVQFSRVISSELEVPSPEVKPLNKIRSWQHLTNAVALLLANHSGKGWK